MYNTKQIISYSLLAFSLSFIGLPIYIYLPNFYADNFDISLKTIAIIILFTRVFDAVQDPIIGVFSDRFASFRKKLIIYLVPLLGLSFLMLFYPLTDVNISYWLAFFMLLTYSLFSIIYINYQAYAVNLTDSYHERTRIITIRETVFIIGIIFASTIPAILNNFYDQTKSFLIIGLIYFIITNVFGVIFYKYAPKNTITLSTNFDFKGVFKSKLLNRFFIIFTFNAIAASIPAVLIMFFVEHVLAANDYLSIFLLIYFFGLFLGVCFWSQLSKFLDDKILTFLISMSFTAFIFVFCYFLGNGNVILYSIICLLAGIGFGGDLCLGYSIITDIIWQEKLKKNESSVFGITNFILKFSLALTSASLIFIIGDLEGNEELKKSFIAFSYAILPVIFRLFAIYFLFKYFKKTY